MAPKQNPRMVLLKIRAFGESLMLLVLVRAVATHKSASLNAKDALGSAASPGIVNKWVLFRIAGRLSPPESFPTSSPSGIAAQCVCLTFK